MKKWKVAIIGVGGIAQSHIAGYRSCENVELYAFCDINEARLRQQGEQHGITRLYTDVHEMLQALPELDAVSVCTWNAAHAPCTIAALNAGKHVLCEKPMALNAAEAETMLQAAKANDRLLMIGFVRRFGNDCDITRSFIEGGQLGELYYAKASYLRRNGCPGGWFGDKARSGGGPLIDLGVHVIDLVRYLAGNPQPVSVYGSTFHKIGKRAGLKEAAAYLSTGAGADDLFDVEDLAVATIRFDSGLVLQVDASFCLNLKQDVGRIELFGTRAGASLDPELEIYNDTNGYLTDLSFAASTALNFNGLFEREIQHFVSCFGEGLPCRAPAEDGLTLMRILDAVYRSAETGHEVVL